MTPMSARSATDAVVVDEAEHGGANDQAQGDLANGGGKTELLAELAGQLATDNDNRQDSEEIRVRVHLTVMVWTLCYGLVTKWLSARYRTVTRNGRYAGKRGLRAGPASLAAAS